MPNITWSSFLIGAAVAVAVVKFGSRVPGLSAVSKALS